MIQYKYMKEEDHFTQTQLPAHIVVHVAAVIATILYFSLIHFTYSLILSLILFSNNASIYRHEW